METIKLKTLGGLCGERRDTSQLGDLEIPVASVHLPFMSEVD